MKQYINCVKCKKRLLEEASKIVRGPNNECFRYCKTCCDKYTNISNNYSDINICKDCKKEIFEEDSDLKINDGKREYRCAKGCKNT